MSTRISSPTSRVIKVASRMLPPPPFPVVASPLAKYPSCRAESRFSRPTQPDRPGGMELRGARRPAKSAGSGRAATQWACACMREIRPSGVADLAAAGSAGGAGAAILKNRRLQRLSRWRELADIASNLPPETEGKAVSAAKKLLHWIEMHTSALEAGVHLPGEELPGGGFKDVGIWAEFQQRINAFARDALGMSSGAAFSLIGALCAYNLLRGEGFGLGLCAQVCVGTLGSCCALVLCRIGRWFAAALCICLSCPCLCFVLPAFRPPDPSNLRSQA